MRPEHIVDTVVHIRRYLLPRKKAEVTFLKDCLILRHINPFDEVHNFTFNVNKPVDVTVNFRLQVYDFINGICYGGRIAIGVSRHLGKD